MFDNILKQYLNKQNNNESQNKPTTHEIFYKNQFSSAYKTDERVIKQIIHNNVICMNENERIKLIIYYDKNTTNSLVSRNNQNAKLPPLKQTNVVYRYNCNIGECELQQHSYIGMTTTTLSRRLTMHLASGGPRNHTQNEHKISITRDMLVKNTNIINSNRDHNRLQIAESLLISKENPLINKQVTGSQRILKLV